MSFYGKMAGAAVTLALLGAATAGTAALGAEVISQAERIADDVAKCYVVKEYNGQVALFEDGAEHPIAVYKTPVITLTEADMNLLKNGIRLRTMTEVARLLEDLEIE